MVGILRPGYEHFTTFPDVMFCGSPKMERGATFSTYEEEFYDFLLSNYLGRDPGSINEADAVKIEDHLSAMGLRSRRCTTYENQLVSVDTAL
jgi:hypothetical protein